MQSKTNWIADKVRNALFRLRYPYVHYKLKKLKIMSIEETLNTIISRNASITRFGDGEMMWLLNITHGSFQHVSGKLSQNLKRVLEADSDILIGLPDGFKSVKQFKYKSGRIWRTELSKYGLSFMKTLNTRKKYYNANISRMYMDYKDYERTEHIFDLLSEVWDNRNVLIVEGETSRLGIGNNLFDGAASIQRIICPARNAFDKYERILDIASDVANKMSNPLILIALGPTATVLAYDLHCCGFQSIDIGHVDVEYEWFLMRAKHKVSLPYKDVSEVHHNNPKIKLLDKKYQGQIIAKIL